MEIVLNKHDILIVTNEWSIRHPRTFKWLGKGVEVEPQAAEEKREPTAPQQTASSETASEPSKPHLVMLPSPPKTKSALKVVPLSLAKANEIVLSLHRHHKKKQIHIFSLGLQDEDGVFHGCAIISKPCARAWNDKHYAEVSRLATDGTYNACSMLYSAAARASKEMGYERIQSYILETEPGTSLKASGWKYHHTTNHHNRHTDASYRAYDAPTCFKQLWMKEFVEEKQVLKLAA